MRQTIRQSWNVPSNDEGVGGGGRDLGVRDFLWGTLLSSGIRGLTQGAPTRGTGLCI